MSLSATSPLPPVTTCLLVRIQPAVSKITPEPTPRSGIVPPNWSVALPSTKIRTTAGPTFAAASMTADDSSIVTGWREPVVIAGLLFAPVATGSSAPLPLRARTVPPEARTAERIEATTMLPVPARRGAATRATSGSTGVTGSTVAAVPLQAGASFQPAVAQSGRCSVGGL